MNETSNITITIENIDINEIAISPTTLLSKLKQTSYDDLVDFLLDHIENKDGSPSISNLTIHNFTFNESNQKGKFRLKFQIDRKFCCSGTEACANDYIDFDFSLVNQDIIAKAAYFNWELNN